MMNDFIENRCIRCGEAAIDNIDLIIDNKKYKIGMCEEHSDLSLKELRELLKSQIGSVEKLRKTVESFGFVMISKEEYDNLKGDKPLLEDKIITENQIEEGPSPNKPPPRKIRRAKNIDPKIKAGAGVGKDGKPYNVNYDERFDPEENDDAWVIMDPQQSAQKAKNYMERSQSQSASNAEIRDCPMCKGACKVGKPPNEKVCPKCGGSGLFAII